MSQPQPLAAIHGDDVRPAWRPLHLRDIAQQFEGQAKRLYHLGLRAVRRSTLADANAERPAEFFEAIFQEQYARW